MLFRLEGHQKNTELQINPQGPFKPASFKNESRRANDGAIFLGQNKFDGKGRQINDFIIEFTQNNKSIKKDKENSQNSCPDRLRGQHSKIWFDTEKSVYMIQDLGIGIGTFLKCAQKVQLNDNNLIQIGASLYGLINIITRAEYQKFTNTMPDVSSDFVKNLNENQLVLRIKFFGSNMYGQVKYFVPEWGSNWHQD